MKLKSFIFLLAYSLISPVLIAQAIDTSFSPYELLIPGSSLKAKMIAIKGGSFTMGSTETEKQRDADEGPQKTFTISSFWMGAYEVTYDEYNTFFTDESFAQNNTTDAITRPSPPYIDFTLGMGKEGGYPANSMQQYGAVMYCRWLYKKTGIFFRLPTEAEWEYACRAGISATYFFGNDEKQLDQYAWYKNNSGNKYHKVGELKPNPWGLYDMLGNVSEWTLDQYEENYFQQMKDVNADPAVQPTKRNPRTVKGGTYQDNAKELRPANRRESDLVWNRRDPQIPKSKWWNADAPFIGFRIIRPLKQPTAEEAEKFFDLYLIK
jgi:formylglycine-generating enzyme required for sulfatase activity